MNKILLPLLFISAVSYAQPEKQVLSDLERIHHLKTDSDCYQCEASREEKFYGPEAALRDLNSGELKFLGRDLMPGSDQNRSCVFKNAKAFVIYNNCMSSRKEPPAMDIEVIPFTGGMVRFYVENSRVTAPISTLNRSQYDGTFSVSYIPTGTPGENMTLAQFKEWKKSVTSSNGGCYIGTTGGAQNSSSSGTCYGRLSSATSDWKTVSDHFWNSPTEDYYSSHKKLRKLAETVKF